MWYLDQSGGRRVRNETSGEVGREAQALQVVSREKVDTLLVQLWLSGMR